MPDTSSLVRILVTCDLHYGLRPEGDRSTEALARLVTGDGSDTAGEPESSARHDAATSGADVFIIAGDVAGLDKSAFSRCLHLFAGFGGLKLLVPGNHDVWTRAGDSRSLYEDELPRLAAGAGFRYLDAGPLVRGAVGFVGSLGWYDYAFRNPALDIPLEAYRRKAWPGAGRWNDARFARWSESDPELTEKLAGRLAGQIREVAPRVDMVVATIHHLPFAELVSHTGEPARDFACAFLGSPRLGEVLLAEPKVRLCLTGHSHRAADITVGEGRPGGPLRVVNPGSVYDRKELFRITLRIEPGS